MEYSVSTMYINFLFLAITHVHMYANFAGQMQSIGCTFVYQ